MSSVAEAIKLFLARFSSDQHYCVAYSGGVDSQVLLHALVHFKSPTVQIRAIHIHHGLQTLAESWAEFCADQAIKLNVSLQVQRVNAKAARGQSPEAAAREARYGAFSTMIQEAEILVTAHNQNDQAETFLLQLLRGAGVKGLSAMPSETSFHRGTLCRPLLGVSREEITAYAAEYQLSWIEDPSNENTEFDRNFLRQKIMPVLRTRWPGVEKTIARSAEHCAEASVLLEEIAAEDYEKILVSEQKFPLKLEPLASEQIGQINALQSQPLSINALLDLSLARQYQVLRHWLQTQRLPLPSAAQSEAIFQDVIDAAPDKNPVMRWPGAEIRRYQNFLYAMHPLEPFDSGVELTWDGRSSLVLPAKMGILEPDDPRLLPIQSALSSGSSPIKIRFRRGGESMRLPGRQGRHTLKNLFQEWQVLPWCRDRIPLIFIDDELTLVLLSAEDQEGV